MVRERSDDPEVAQPPRRNRSATSGNLPLVRVCLAYDCLYPFTVGGAERWYRNLASELVASGHEVTYLTRRQWDRDVQPEIPGVRVVVVSAGRELYVGDRRRIWPPLLFGAGVLRHLARNRGRYDAVHLCAFPYFSLLGARLALLASGVPIGVDWFEVWSREYWREYLGGAAGRLGEAIQRLCIWATPTAYVYSDLHGLRLEEEGLSGEVVRPGGLYSGPLEPQPREPGDAPLAVFAGRHIPEKQAQLVPPAVMRARRRVPNLRGLVLGDGPRHEAVLQAIAEADAVGVVEAPGFVDAAAVQDALGRATVNVLPSSREGYGMVVIEAAALGTPSVVLAGRDNAAVELVEEGVNGFVADSADGLAGAIVAAQAGGHDLRESTSAWFARNAQRLSASAAARAIADRLEHGQRSRARR